MISLNPHRNDDMISLYPQVTTFFHMHDTVSRFGTHQRLPEAPLLHQSLAFGGPRSRGFVVAAQEEAVDLVLVVLAHDVLVLVATVDTIVPVHQPK